MSRKNFSVMFLSIIMVAGIFSGCQQPAQDALSADGKYLLSEKIEYDYSGLLAKKVVTKYSYDENGLLTAEECSDGSKILYEYNENGEEIKETAYNVDGSEDYCYRTEYDENGNITLQESDFGCDMWVYSSSGTTKEYVRIDSFSDEITSEKKYDENGKIKEIAYREVSNDYKSVSVREKYGEYENIIERTAYSEDGTECSHYKLRTEPDGNKINKYGYTDDGKEYYLGYEKYNDDGKIAESIEYYPNGKAYSTFSYAYSKDVTEMKYDFFEENGDKDWELCGVLYTDDNNDSNKIGMDIHSEDGRLKEFRYVYDSYGHCLGGNEHYADSGEKTMEVIKTEKGNEIEYKVALYEDTPGYYTLTYDKYGNILKEEGDFNLNGTRTASRHKTEYKYIPA